MEFKKRCARGFAVFFFILFSIENIFGQAPETIFELLPGSYVRTWVYVFGDEFNGTSVDPVKWFNSHNGERVGCNGVIADNWIRTNGSNLNIVGGDLQIIADNVPLTANAIDYLGPTDPWCGGQNSRTFPYTGGMIYSNTKFRYGMFKCRFTIPSGTGLWPAFWLYGDAGEEIDCFEGKGERHNEIHYDLHNYSSWSSHHIGETDPGGWIDVGVDLTAGSHEIMCIWEPGLVMWYLDYTFLTYENVDFNSSMNVLANIGTAASTSGNWAPGPDGTTPFPAIFNIDYIRVYQVLDCDNPHQPLCDHTTSNYNDFSLIGTTIRTGYDAVAPECPTGSYVAITPGHSLTMIATDRISIFENFAAEEGSFVEAKILDCFEDRAYQSVEFIELATDKTRNTLHLEESQKPQDIDLVQLYPNPASNSFSIKSNKGNLIQGVKLYNVLGYLIQELNFVDVEEVLINTKDIAKGLYIVELKTQSNVTNTTLIIQ